MNENATPMPGALVLKVTRVGDSLGLVLPQEIVDRMTIREGDELRAVTNVDGSLRLILADDHERAMRIADEIMDEYDETFRILAKS